MRRCPNSLSCQPLAHSGNERPAASLAAAEPGEASVTLSPRSRAAATLVVGLVFAFALGSTGALAPDDAAAFGSSSALTSVSGEVLVSHAGESFAPAREGDVLVAGDTIRTASNAAAEITYFEGSSVRLGRTRS